MAVQQKLGVDAINTKGWWLTHRWLILRRFSQLAILALFLAGPWMGVWVMKGNLASSVVLDTVPLSDPYLMLQVFLTGHVPETTAITGLGIVLGFYLLVGGRVYCSWVCPINPVTDFSAWLQRRLKIRATVRFSRSTRYWVLLMSLLLALTTGTLAWELINPVSTVFRGLVFGMGLGWIVLLSVFLFDLVIGHRSWCGALCPVGAFYSVLGKGSLVKVAAPARARCNDCMECFVVCPEPRVIRPALKGAKESTALITDSECTNCGRCIDICSKDVFTFTTRFSHLKEINTADQQMEVLP